MADALGGKATVIARLIADLGLAPSPVNPVAVAIRCDCLQVTHVEQVAPWSVTIGFCLLSTRGIRAQGERSRLRAWCVAQGYAMSYDCPYFEELDNGEVVLQVHAPPVPGLEE